MIYFLFCKKYLPYVYRYSKYNLNSKNILRRFYVLSQLIPLISGELHAAMQANSARPDWLGGLSSLRVLFYFILEIFLKIMSI